MEPRSYMQERLLPTGFLDTLFVLRVGAIATSPRMVSFDCAGAIGMRLSASWHDSRRQLYSAAVKCVDKCEPLVD